MVNYWHVLRSNFLYKKTNSMKLAYYYHIPIYKQNNKIYIPSYFGVFIDSLASEVEKLYLVLHESVENEKYENNYILKANNVEWINLGYKTASWHRTIFNKKILKEKLKAIEKVDAFIVRSPSPLAPYFHKFFPTSKIWFMIVGDYIESSEQMKIGTVREKIVYQYLKLNTKHFETQIKKSKLLVNSGALFEKYKIFTNNIHQIRTTTLSKKDFFYREDTCLGTEINLLYTGRIEKVKGLFELLEAFWELRKERADIYLNFVGWESDEGKPNEKSLINRAEELGIREYVKFHGMKAVGEELNSMYRKSDIYVIPSYHEGFPRTIWEALANCIPVIATKVGGIPNSLTNGENAILIEPQNVNQIKDSINSLLLNSELRQKLIKGGLIAVNENTLEIQTQKMIAILNTTYE
jgi:glycosyltransferase involved in cell wall biosynthesis